MPIKEKLEEESRYCIYSIASVILKKSYRTENCTFCILFYYYFVIFLVNTVVGKTATLLNNAQSREKETNIGNLVADSMIDAVSVFIKESYSKRYERYKLKLAD